LLNDALVESLKEAEEKAAWQSLAEEAEALRIQQPAAERPLPRPSPSGSLREDAHELPYRIRYYDTGGDWEALEAEAEAASNLVGAELKRLQLLAQGLSSAALVALQREATSAAQHINLDEVATQAIIEQQISD
jgi:hypothetical protein